jgi:hypothetical protein
MGGWLWKGGSCGTARPRAVAAQTAACAWLFGVEASGDRAAEHAQGAGGAPPLAPTAKLGNGGHGHGRGCAPSSPACGLLLPAAVES